jgi:hypothetical protein
MIMLKSTRNSTGQKTHEKMLTISSQKGNANQNYTKIPPHPCQSSHHQQHHQQQVLVSMWGKRNPYTLLVGTQTSTTLWKKNLGTS